jgi:cellulose synthase/poly-beta-1,6-N-acetylglucosamine synthase-like glycosyltransferase
MAGYVAVGLGLSMVVLVISLMGPIIGAQVEPILGITVDATFLTLFFFIFATIYNAILMSTLVLSDKEQRYEGESTEHVFSLMIPCRNEESVIVRTVEALTKVSYPRDSYQVLVINDGSVDDTGSLADQLSELYDNVQVLHIPREISGRGKSEALNIGFRQLQSLSPFRDNPFWVIGVLDSDGVVDGRILRKASFKLMADKVGAVQALVRIQNYKQSILTRLQDIEFVTFAKVTQTARSLFKGAVALGGNGQFIKASVLKEIAFTDGSYWKRDALTEDLDLGTRVLMKGFENSFLSTTAVYQSGVTTLGSLYKQRTRWSWGALQCFFYYIVNPRVLKSNISRTRKLDLMYYLSATMLPPLILMVWALSIFGIFGLFQLYNPFPFYFMAVNSVSFLPLIGYGLWSVRKEYEKFLLLPLVIVTAAYTYHWVICSLRAMVHMLKGDKPHWVVTQKKEAKIEEAVVS